MRRIQTIIIAIGVIIFVVFLVLTARLVYNERVRPKIIIPPVEEGTWEVIEYREFDVGIRRDGADCTMKNLPFTVSSTERICITPGPNEKG